MTFPTWNRPRTIVVCNDEGDEVEIKIDASNSIELAEEKAIAKTRREGKITGSLRIKKLNKGR